MNHSADERLTESTSAPSVTIEMESTESTPVESCQVDSTVVESTAVDQSGGQSLWSRMNALRWGYLIPRCALLLVFWAVLTLVIEPGLKLVTTWGAGAALDTMVGLDQFRLGLFATEVKLERLQIADRDRPGSNALEVQRITAQFDRDALLRKKFIINQATVSGINWQTESDLQPQSGKSAGSSWSFPLNEQAKKITEVATKSGSAALQSLLQATLEQYDPRQLETVQLAELKEGEWQSRFDAYRQRAETLEHRINLLKEQIELGSKGNPLDQLDRFARIAREVDALAAEGKQLKVEFSSLSNVARTDMTELDAARQRDLQKIQQGLEEIPVNGQELTVAILGPETARQCQQAAGWLAFVQKCMNVATEDYEPERNYGRTIDFDQAAELPIFLVRQFDLSGKARFGEEIAPFAGRLQHLTHDPKRYGKPCDFQFAVRHHGDYNFTGTCDLTGTVPRYTMKCRLESSEFPTQQLLADERMKMALKTGLLQGLIDLELVGDQIEASFRWKQSEVEFVVEGDAAIEQKELAQLGFQPFTPADLLRRSVAGVDMLRGEVHLSGPVAQPQITLQSNIGETLVAGMQREFRREVSLRKQEAEQLASQEIDAKLQQLTGKIDQEYRDVLAKLNLNESLTRGVMEKTAIRPASGVLDRLFR